MSEFPSIAQNEHRIGDGFVIELMQHRENKNCGLSSSWYSLAYHILAHNCIRYALLLHRRGLLKTALIDSSVKLILEQEVFEASTMDAGVRGYSAIKINKFSKF